MMKMEPQPKKSFDFIEAASKAYAFAWDKKKTLLYLAMWPIGIKFATMMIIMLFEMQDQYLRQGLLLLPAYFAEGWLAAQVIRLLLVADDKVLGVAGPGQRFMQRSLERNRRNLVATIILYTLVMLISSVSVGLALLSVGGMDGAMSPAAPSAEPNALLSLLSIVIIAFVIWAFRFIWLYVAVGLGYSIKEFAVKLRPFYLSIYMIGTWLICIVPVGLVMMILSEFIISGSGGAEVTPGYEYFITMYLLRSVFEALLAIITTTAMAIAITSMIEGTRAD